MARENIKRSTIYLESELHKALRLKSIVADRSISDLVNDAVRASFTEDADDLAAFEGRADEPDVSFEEAVKALKRSGRI